MATVFLAWDAKLKVWRAIKVLLPAFVSKRKLRKRFENEAHAMARLEHANIVRIYDVGLEGKVPYMVMELAEGGCIIDWLDRHGPMPPALALQVIDQLCAGIEHAHEAGIVHRDIKPHNILVTSKGVCKVTDFGIAQVMDRDALTKTGSVMGTWGFMAPEQRIDAKNVDERADVFGIGATVYNLLANKQPTELYVADDDDEVFEMIPRDILPVIMKACAYKPRDRYASVGELRQALADLAPEQPSLPKATPSLVLEHHELPDSVESAHFSPTIVDELEEALGDLGEDDPPSDLHLDDHVPASSATPSTSSGRVLPYYMPQKREAPQERPLGGGIRPAYIDQEELERSETSMHAHTPVSEDITVDPTPNAPAAEEAEEGGDVAVKAIAGLLVLMIVALGVVGWGLISVNGAENTYLDSLRGVGQQMDIELQGPVIDGLVLAGAARPPLEKAHAVYGDAERLEQLAAAQAYLHALNSAATRLGPGPTVTKLQPIIAELETSTERAQAAENQWGEVANAFPGNLAVSLGLAQPP